MENLIIFDSDFVIANNNKMVDIIKKLETYNCYITEVSIKEISHIRSIEKSKKMEELKKEFINYKELQRLFVIDNEELKTIVKNQTKDRLLKIFNNNVIRYHAYSINSILDRAYNKIPPFDKSDKGLKDTIIFLNIIDFIKGKEVKKAFFVTNDSDFIAKKDDLVKEVLNKTECVYDIVSGNNSIERLYNYFGVGNDKEIKTLSDEIDTSYNIKDIRKKLNNICWDLFHSENPNPYDLNNNYIANFHMLDLIKKEDIINFLNDLKKNIDINVFNSKVKISDFFENPFLFKNEMSIDIEIFEQLNDIYQEIKNNPKHVNALANLLYDNFILFYEPNEEDIKF